MLLGNKATQWARGGPALPMVTSGREGIFQENRSKSFLHRLSFLADHKVESSVGAKLKPMTVWVFAVNSMTGLSVLTIPLCVQQAGLVLGSLIIFLCMAVCFVTVTFILEALTLANAISYEQAECHLLNSDETARRKISKTKQQFIQNMEKSLSEEGHDPSQALLPRADTLDLFSEEVRRLNAAREFKIRDRVEVGAMGERVFYHMGPTGKVVSLCMYTIILAFTIGTILGLTVLVNSSLAQTICQSMKLLEAGACDSHAVYQRCVLGTFICTLPLCFADLQKTKIFTCIIMASRLLALAIMLVVSYQMCIARVQDVGLATALSRIPLWNPAGFVPVFSNAFFLFCIHHYVPSMMAPLDPQEKAPCVASGAYLTIAILVVTLCAAALVAFSPESGGACAASDWGQSCQILPLYNFNFSFLTWGGGTVALFLVAYPSLGLASLPVAVITTRNTLSKVLGLPATSSDKPFTRSNLLLTVAVLSLPTLVALVTEDVQAVVKYTGSYGGLSVALLCPVLLLVKFRTALHLDKAEADYPRPLKSLFAGPVGYVAVLIFYVLALVLVTVKLFFL